MDRVFRIAAVGMIVGGASLTVSAQKADVADLARRMSGTWVINRALSPEFAPGRSNGRGGAAYTLAGFVVQRGGGRGGGGDAAASSTADLTPEERAERAAMQQIRLISPKLVIAATPESFAITDERGEHTCAANGKGNKVQMFEVPVEVKCRWDKDRVRQEFATTRSKLIRTWGLDDKDHLVLKAKLEGIGLNSPEATAVFDRSQ